MRTPYGSAGNREIEIIRDQGYLVYLWSLDTLDWAQDNSADILQNIKDYLRSGDIILMHAFSGQSRSAAILPEIIEFIISMGFEIRAL
jgi:peptidoglycan/xylan/chitin deacetylase (PgdA/CDA1 family)